VVYVDPLADDQTDVVKDVNGPAVILMAHNRKITFGYTGEQADDPDYFQFHKGSVVVDPFRKEVGREGCIVMHYGNSRGV
jgi:hypothetical protein